MVYNHRMLSDPDHGPVPRRRKHRIIFNPNKDLDKEKDDG